MTIIKRHMNTLWIGCSPFMQEVEGSTPTRGTCPNDFFRSNRPGYPHPVCSELENSGIRVAVGDGSVTERRRWRPPYQTSVGNTSSYNLPNINNTQTIHCNTQQYYNSFLPATVRNWNELSQEIRDSNTLTTFKHKLNANIRGGGGSQILPYR